MSVMGAHVLVVDDEAPIREALSALLEDEGFLVSTVGSGEEAVAWLQRHAADCVLLDIWLPGIDGVETLARIRELDPDLPVIMMSGHATIDAAVEATRKGAFDFLEKPLSSDRLLVQLRNAIEQRRLRLDKQARAGNAELSWVGTSEASQALARALAAAARSDGGVLFVGERGSGKRYAARVVHAHSRRREGPWVEVFVPEDEAEAERVLFGDRKSEERGALARAHQGAIWIEGVARLAPRLQEKLACAVRARRVEGFGGLRTLPCDVRVFAGRLPDDPPPAPPVRALLATTIEVPPLRDRREDIPALAAFFADEIARELGCAPVSFTEEAMRALIEYAWPGNVRELRNVVEHCTLLYPGETLSAEKLPISPTQGIPFAEGLQFREARARFERAFLLYHLERAGWNISRAAREAGIERSQLHRKMQQLGITPPKERA